MVLYGVMHGCNVQHYLITYDLLINISFSHTHTHKHISFQINIKMRLQTKLIFNGYLFLYMLYSFKKLSVVACPTHMWIWRLLQLLALFMLNWLYLMLLYYLLFTWSINCFLLVSGCNFTWYCCCCCCNIFCSTMLLHFCLWWKSLNMPTTYNLCTLLSLFLVHLY